MQVLTKLFALTLFWSLTAAEPAAAQTRSQTQKPPWNERLPIYRLPRTPFDGPVPFLSESHTEIMKPRATAARDSNTTLIGSWIGGGCAAAAVSGTHAYFGGGRNFIIADVSDPGNPTELGSLLLPDSPVNLTVRDNLVYVAAFDAGLRIIDVSDPPNPTEVGFIDTRLAVDVTAAGNYAYVASGSDGLRIIDVSDPANPTEVGFFDTRGYSNGVALSGDHAYITVATEGLRIIDVSNPANPTQVGFFDTVEGTVFPIFDLAFDVAVSGDFAYVTDQTDGVRIINVSDPANPAEVGFFDNDTSSFRQVAVIGDFVYITEGGGLRIIFVANPASPIEVGFLKLRGFGHTVTVDGNTAYVADTIGMRIIDVSNFSSPNVIGFFETGADPYGITVSGDYAYLAASLAGLQIFDVSNPQNPTFVSSFSYESCFDCGRDVALKGDLVYLVGEVGLRIINVSDPTNPAEIGAIVTGGFPNAVAVSENYAYVADVGGGGLRIFDVSSPQNPTEVGFFANAIAQDVVVRGNLAYVAGFDAGLRIIDVSNRASPIEVGFFDTKGIAYGVAVNGNYAYLAEPPHPAFPAAPGLRIIDVSNPRNPAAVGFFEIDGFPLRVTVSGNYAYVADPFDGLRIIDVSNPQSPKGAGFFESAGLTQDVVVDADTACVAIDELYIIRNDAMLTSVKSPSDQTPERFHLRQSYPNPLRASVSNSGTTITFTLSKAANVTLEVYNMLGEKVTTLVKGAKPAGEHIVNFDASSLTSGIYFYTLTADDGDKVKRNA